MHVTLSNITLKKTAEPIEEQRPILNMQQWPDVQLNNWKIICEIHTPVLLGGSPIPCDLCSCLCTSGSSEAGWFSVIEHFDLPVLRIVARTFEHWTMCRGVGVWQLLPGMQSLFRLVSNTIDEGERDQVEQYIIDFISDVEHDNDSKSLKMIDAVLAAAVHSMQFNQEDPHSNRSDDKTEDGYTEMSPVLVSHRVYLEGMMESPMNSQLEAMTD